MIEIALVRIFDKPDKFLPQLFYVLSAQCTYRKHFRMIGVEKSSAKKLLHFQPDLREPGGLNGIHLGDDREAKPNAKQTADGHVFHGLWLDAFLGGDDQQDRSDTPGPGEHVVNKQAVTRHIDKADSERSSVARRSIEKGKAEIDGNAAALLFRQAIGIDPSECSNESGLAVIDMPCRSNHYRFGRCGHATDGLRRFAGAAKRGLHRIPVRRFANQGAPGLRERGRPRVAQAAGVLTGVPAAAMSGGEAKQLRSATWQWALFRRRSGSAPGQPVRR